MPSSIYYRSFLLLLSLICFQFSIGQDDIGNSNNDSFNAFNELNRSYNVPNSPEAQAFEKYGNTDVSLYTGTPNIQVPIYTHKGRELNLPINLTYDATGVKVTQLATGVGLSWNLNVGGRISRVANGLPDDYLGQTMHPYKTVVDAEVRIPMLSYLNNHTDFDSQADAIAYLNFLKKVNDSEYDVQPDYFSFNALGINEMFVIDVETREARALNNPRITATYSGGVTGSSDAITSWIVTNDDGTKLYFTKAERTYAVQQEAIGSPQDLIALKKEYNSSWLLTKIVSANGKDEYLFEYEDLEMWTDPKSAIPNLSVYNIVAMIEPGDDPNMASPATTPHTDYCQSCFTEYQIKQWALKTIKHKGYTQYKTIVTFDLGSRFDISVASKVTDITIYKDFVSNDILKSYHLNHSYFKTSPSVVPSSNVSSSIRLKLDGIDILDSQLNTVSNYQFDYIDEYELPSTYSIGQDYYGYSNGSGGSQMFLNYELYPKSNWPNITDGANRDPDFNFGKKGLLNKITYPTGGYTEFEYEKNLGLYTSASSTHPSVNQYGVANTTLHGGSEWTNAFPYGTWCNTGACIDTYLQEGLPKLKHVVVNIPESRHYDFHASLTGNHQMLGKHLIMFKRNDIASCDGSTPAMDIANMMGENNFPGWTMPNNTIVYNNNASSNYDHTQSIYLTAGCYQITMINPEVGSTHNVLITYEATTNITTGGETSIVEKAGGRIKTIKDYTAQGELALEKNYSYSTGTVISQPVYEWTSIRYAFDNSGYYYPRYTIVNRRTHASGTDKPHIGYEKVTETVTDFIDIGNNNNNKTVHEFNTENAGSHHTGTYNYFINGRETATSYSVDYKLGKPKRITKFGLLSISENSQLMAFTGKYINTSEYYRKLYYNNRGINLLVDESRGDKYPLPKLINGKYKITYIMPELIPMQGGIYPNIPYSECMTVTGGNQSFCGSTTFSPEIARLDYNESVAYGHVGNIKTYTELEKVLTFGQSGENEEESESLGISKTTTYNYYDEISTNLDDPLPSFLTKDVISITSEGNSTKKEFFYPDNFETEYTTLLEKNILTIPVQTSYYSNGNLASRQKTEYIEDLPSAIKTAKNGMPLEDRVVYELYKNKNVVQLRQSDGTSTVLIWGYDNTHVIAKIDNATYQQIEALSQFGIGFNINGYFTVAQENQLRAQLTNSQITTYTYDPMVGVTSITDPRGRTQTFEYDAFHRLKLVKDAEGNILSTNEYNYRTQN